MRLMELFDDEPSDLIGRLRADIMDILLPLAANGVPHVTIQQVMDKLHEQPLGVVIDRALVTQVLDPEQVKLVDKIEGDRIHFKQPDDGEVRKVDADEQEKEKARLSAKARKQAKKEITKR